MENYKIYISNTLLVIETLFTDMDILFKELRTTALRIKYEKDDDEEYCKFVKETFEKISEKICPACHTLDAAKDITIEMSEKYEESHPVIECAFINLFEFTTKYDAYVKMYEAHREVYEEAIEFLNMQNS